MPTVTVVYFNHRLQVQESRGHQVPDLERVSLEAVVDLFNAQIGTVLAVYHDETCLYRSGVVISDLID